MLKGDMTILALSAHPDDAELGCGGTLAKWADEKHKIVNCIFTLSEEMPYYDKREDEANSAGNDLGMDVKFFNKWFKHRKLHEKRQDLLEILLLLKDECEPDIILCPSVNDMHQDHKTLALETIRAFKLRTILCYEMLWNNINFNTQCFVKLNRSHVLQKIKAISNYKSYGEKSYLNANSIFSLAATRGLQGGGAYAESFEVVRLSL